MIQPWFILILFSIIVSATGEIAQKLSVTSKDNISAETINFHIAVLQCIFSIIYLIIADPKVDLSVSPIQIFNLILISFLSFFFFKFLYSSYKGNSASISQVIFSLSALVSTIFGIIFFQESTSTSKFLGIILIVIAVAIASYKRGEKFSKYNLYALVAALIYGLITSIDKSFATTMDVHYYQVIDTGAFVIMSFVLAGGKIFTETKQITKISYKTILISAISFTIFNKLTFLAYSLGGEVGKVDAVNNTAIFLIILMEIFILKDKTNLKTKIISAILCVSGVLILGFIN